MDTKQFELLSEDEKSEFMDGLRTYLGYEEEIRETRTAQKNQVARVAEKIELFSRKDVKKLFTYFKKNVKPSDLREDAEVIERIRGDLNPGLVDDED